MRSVRIRPEAIRAAETASEKAVRGSALLPVVLLMLLFSAIAAGVAAVIRVEVRLADRFRQAAEALYAAQAGLDVAMCELRTLASWAPAVSGAQYSQYSQGPFLGAKAVPGGGAVEVCCGPGSAFERWTAEARTSAVPSRRALMWRPFLWTTFDALAPRQPRSRLYLLVAVADVEDVASREGEDDENERLLVRAEAIDPSGLRRTIESLVLRLAASGRAGDEGGDAAGETGPPALGIVTWREVR